MRKYAWIAILILGPAVSFASIMCPGRSFNQISEGMSPEEVIATCGPPDLKNELIQKNENIPQKWSYLVPQAVYMGGSQQFAQGTLEVRIDFNEKGIVDNINVNGIAVGQTTICGNAIALKDNKDQIKNACGKPRYIDKQTAEVNPDVANETKVIEFIYTSVSPQVTLIFENGKFTGKR